MNDNTQYAHALNDSRTSHVLHLILTIVTAGFWSILWFGIAMSNYHQQDKLKAQLRYNKAFVEPDGFAWFVVMVLYAILFAVVPFILIGLISV